MKRLGWLAVLLFVIGLALSLRAGDVAGEAFVDDRFEDFAAGTLDAGGQNMYVSRDGKVRTIHRFDLNDDGYLDLLFNCTHDTYQMLPATAGTVARDRSTRSLDIAVEGSQRVVLADLNGDGRLDIAVLGATRWRPEQPEGRIIRVFWGSPGGFSPVETLDLGVAGAIDLAAGDFDGDGARDLAVLRGDGKGTVVWASRSKATPTRLA